MEDEQEVVLAHPCTVRDLIQEAELTRRVRGTRSYARHAFSHVSVQKHACTGQVPTLNVDRKQVFSTFSLSTCDRRTWFRGISK